MAKRDLLRRGDSDPGRFITQFSLYRRQQSIWYNKVFAREGGTTKLENFWCFRQQSWRILAVFDNNVYEFYKDFSSLLRQSSQKTTNYWAFPNFWQQTNWAFSNFWQQTNCAFPCHFSTTSQLRISFHFLSTDQLRVFLSFISHKYIQCTT